MTPRAALKSRTNAPCSTTPMRVVLHGLPSRSIATAFFGTHIPVDRCEHLVPRPSPRAPEHLVFRRSREARCCLPRFGDLLRVIELPRRRRFGPLRKYRAILPELERTSHKRAKS
ncbi:uncharacterized protein TRAVEDRAFT_57693 [Trametes versicolor FP-101664 SS1]|uniref:uncharacterized protein n=1 Tax=Trametes versicolor (strain FP-101664) TaxID=717944 RepID=UPI00046220F2|nr:uncharacterized protein TRAVEDRAFT_57693 [Trametes versicolor FP-101664 SS1]EIW60450.1 hypothetical protein TRAVEDRAFT_57693 [Trametes versicolor FP-101664 SS1]